LIFVFTITQLTEPVIEAHTILEWLRIPALLAIVWWMYAGYVWLTNNCNMPLAKPRALLFRWFCANHCSGDWMYVYGL
jgi:low temperature requirement protein LtrA